MTTTLEDISDTQCNYTLHAPLSIGCPVRIPISPVVKPYIPIASWTPLRWSAYSALLSRLPASRTIV